MTIGEFKDWCDEEGVTDDAVLLISRPKHTEDDDDERYLITRVEDESLAVVQGEDREDREDNAVQICLGD